MKVIVFGATGKTGRHVVTSALESGHQITAFGRSVDRLDISDDALKTYKGDVFDRESVSRAVAGHDAAIVCLGSTGLRDKTTLAAGTRTVVDAMVEHRADRLVVLSAAGVDDSWKQIPWSSRLLFRTMLRNVFADHHAQEAIVKQSPLDWTIVRAAVLKDDPARAPTPQPTSPRPRRSTAPTWLRASSINSTTLPTPTRQSQSPPTRP